LYNLHRAKEHLTEKNRRTLIIVEGFKAVWYLNLIGYENVVACMGSRLTPGQMNLIYTNNVFNVALLFDGDKAGRQGMKAASEDLMGKVKIKTIEVDEDKSPDDYTFDVLIEKLKNIPN